jgi:hypothetical protein
MPRRLSEDQKQLLTFFPTDGSAIGGYALMAQLQEAGWRTREIEHVMGELREMGEILVGRGGSGGSIRHVRNDRQALLDVIDEFAAEGTSCTRAQLQSFMEWHPDYLEQVLDALLERGSIAVEPGRRGKVTRAQSLIDPTEDIQPTVVAADEPDEDERHLLDLLPEIDAIGNTRLRNLLVTRHGWDDERYWETRKRLRQRGLVEVGRGRGGSLRRVRSTSVVTSELPPEPEPRPAEQRDEEMIWSGLPENGDEVDLSALQGRSEWPASRFFATLDQMVADQRIHWRNSKVKRLIPVAPTPEPVTQPTPPADTPAPFMKPHEALYVFVRTRFAASSLKRFLTIELGAQRVADDVLWDEAFNDVVYNVCDELRRSGYVDAELFQHLRKHFDRLHPEIDNLERYVLRAEPR